MFLDCCGDAVRRATMRERFVRHGNYLTHISMVIDPVYLTEPLIRTTNFAVSARELTEQNWLWVCEPVDEIAGRAPGAVPAYMPNENPFLSEFQKRHGLPAIATRGGAETAYPEFTEKMKGAK